MRAKLTSLLMMLCLLMVFAAVVQAAPAGKVTNLEGKADLTVPGQPAKALFIGDAVNVGDILRTKSGSKLEVTWIDGSIARLSENSRLKVTEFTLGAKKRSTILSLFRGKVQNVVTGTTKLFGTKEGSKYEVHTPTSVCGVRGTTFFTYHENGVSGALFTEGQGFMYSKGQPENVKPVAPGVLMVVTSANKPPEAKPAKPGDATKLFNATNPSEKKKDDKKSEDKKEGGTGGGTSGTGGTTSTSGKDESTGGTKKEDTGSTTGTTGTTGTGDTASGTTGTGGTTTMLGGDPTATLGTAAPGTLASKIETGTVADSPGTSSPLTNPTTPVSPVVVPVIEPTPTETFTKINQEVAQGTITGTLTGSIGDTTNTGTINLAGTGMESIYVLPTTGSLSDGSTDNAYLAGIPGSWRGLFIGLSRKNTSVSLLSSGDLSGAYAADQALSASGSIARAAGYGISADSQYQSFTDLPLLVLQNVSIGQAFSDPVIYGPASGDITTDGIMGYNTSAGGILGIWGAQTLNGTYINASGETGKTVNLYHYNYYPEYQAPSDYFAFGSAAITDDLKGHTTVKSSALTYLDRYYLGTLSLDYRGVYALSQDAQLQTGVSYPYSSIGTGIYNLQPLSWSGDWGGNRNYYDYYLASLYGNFYDPENQQSYMEFVAHEMGLAGGLTPFWSQTSRMTAMGYVVDDDGNPVAGEAVAGPLLWNSGIAVQALTGATVEDVFTPDAEFTGVTAGVWKGGLMKGSAYAIYKTAAGQAGWLIGRDTISGLYDSEIGMWKAEGDLTPTQRIAQLPDGVTSADLEVFHDIAFGISGGNFGGQGNITNQYSILQTTFYGKQISVYDEEYQEYVEKILPLRWGIYDVMAGSGNAFSGKTAGASSWTAKIGGYGPTQMNAPFFYLADITGTWAADETISGQLTGAYMTPLYKGVLSGPFYGLYNVGGSDESGQYGGWSGQSIGTYNVTQKLAHSAVLGGWWYYDYYPSGNTFLTDGGGRMYEAGEALGLLGGTTAPWSGSSSFNSMGLFAVDIEAEYGRGSYLWNAALQGRVPHEINETPSAGGVYAGYSAALWRADNYIGAIRTIYLTPPDASTGKSTAGFLAGSDLTGTVYTLRQGIEYNEYYEADYAYAMGFWESTGTLAASAPVAKGLDPAAITPAHGYIDGTLGGSFAGTGVLTNDTYSGNLLFFMNGSTPLPFGVYDLKLGGDTGGTFSGKPAGVASWNGNLGGTLSLLGNDDAYYDHGYWFAGASGQWSADGEITGNVANGKYLTTMQSGTLSGPFYGLYTETATALDGTKSGTWVGQSVGNYEGQNLTFVSNLNNPVLRYYNGSYWQSDSYSISGLLGGTDSLWSSTPSTPVLPTAMGTVSLSGTPAATGHIFNDTTGSHNYKNSEQVNTTYDGGAYYSFYGGSVLGKAIAANLAGIYIYNGKAGLLQGGLNGDVYTDIGAWEASGSLYKEEKGSTTIAANELQNNLGGGYMTGVVSSEDRSLLGSTGFNQTKTLYDKNGGTNWIMNSGIWQADFGGSYSGTITSPWTAKAGGEGIFGPYYSQTGASFIDDCGSWLADISGGTASGNSLSAGISGWYLTKYTKGTLAGNMIGTYGTSGNYWQAAAVGTFGDKQVLAYSASVYGGWGSYNTTPGSEGLVPDGYGIMGGTGGVSSLFSGKADINGMGYYFRSEDSSLFTMVINNNYPFVGPETNPFHIYYGGSRVAASEDYPEWFEGKMMGFYGRNWDGTKYNEIGILTSGPLIVDGEDSGFSVWGDLYPNVENPGQNKMWAIPSDEDQGTLAYTAKPGTVSSLSIVESEWSPVAKVDGDLQGTMRMKSAHIDGIEDWGVWISAMGGSYSGTLPERWASQVGWRENASGKPSYSIADVDGYYYNDGALWGGVIGRFLNPDNMGIFTGDMVGISGNGNWQAMGVGGFNVIRPLAFSSGVSGYVYQTTKGTLNIDSYLMPGTYGYSVAESGTEFETVYFRANSDVYGQYVKYGWQREKARASNSDQGTSLTYYPNDSMQMFTISHGVPHEALGKTSDLTGQPDFYASPSTSQIVMSQGYNILTNDFPFSGTLSVDPANKQFAKVFSQTVEDFYAVTRVIPDINDPLAKTFQGIMGGYVKDDDPDKSGRTLWNATTYPMGLALMGEHAGFDGSASMTSGIESSTNGSGTTPDGGAYYGFLTHNVNADRTVRGMFYGLYISPEGNAGFLQSTNIEGDSYAGLEMWEASGDITSREVLSGIGVSPANLLAKDGSNYANLMFGAMSGNVEYGGTSGDFVSGGSIRKLAMDSGYTVSIKGYPCNGIFITGGSGGTYANPLGAATWQADSAGYAIFGYPGNFGDYGIWRLNVDDTESSWAENKIYAPVTGEFLSYTKQGTLTGTFIGGYSGTNAGIWGGNTSGVYERTRYVDFSSGMTGNVFYNGLVKWISGGTGSESNSTSYYIFGDPDNFPAEKMYVHKTTYNSGTYTETRYSHQGYTDDANPIVYTKTTWQYNVGEGGSIANLKLLESKNISNDDYLAEVGAMRSGVTDEYTGYRLDDNRFQGVFAGFNNDSGQNLWYNIAHNQPTEIALAGLYDVWGGKTPGIFTAGIASFNPAVSMNPLINSTSQIGGAYVAMLGGAFGTKTVPYDTLGGLLSGIYYKDGAVGFLSGTWSGSNWTDIGYLKGSGAIDGGYPLGTGISEGDFALTSANFASKIITLSNQLSFDEGSVTVLTGDQVIPRSAEVRNSYIDTRYLSTVGFWGIEQKVAAGTKAQGLDPKAWAWEIPIPNGTEYKGVEIISTSNGISTGGYVGATQQAEAGVTLVKAGSIKGLFDPNATTWQAVSQGTFMETNTFLAKVASLDEAGKAAFMNATKIPAVLAGSATLSQGSEPVNNLSNVKMNNVGFYAYSTGVAPKIWATNNVSGNYSATPSTSGPSVPLSGNGLNATFNVNHWNGSTWGANVAGSGNLSGGSYTGPVQFVGGAAGAIQPTTGSFSGTGAGIAK